MSLETTPAASQPVPQAAQNSDGKGSKNVSAASLQAMLVRANEAPKEKEAVATDSPEEGVPETPQEQQPAEATDAAESQDATTPEADAEDESSFKDTKLTPDQQAKIDKRIGKSVAKQKAAEEKAAALEARLAELEKAAPEQPPVVVAPNPKNPLANINDLNGLAERQKEAREIKHWAEDVLDSDGISNGIMVGDKLMTKAEIKAIAREAERTLAEHIPARAQFLRAKEEADARAKATFGWMTDKSSPEYVQAQTALRQNPWLAELPNASELIGIQMLGLQKLQEMQQAKQKPAATAKPRPPASQTSVSSTGAPTRTSEDTVRRKQITAEIDNMKSTKRNFSASDAVALLKKQAALNSR